MPYEKILIAVDDSVESMKAARAGFQLARQLNAYIAILYVIDKGREVGNPDLGTTAEESGALLREEAERTLSQYVEMYGAGREIFRFTPEGKPDEDIVRIAAEWKADLIVMGTHSRSGLSRLLNGSVAEYVIRHSGLPVLVTSSKSE